MLFDDIEDLKREFTDKYVVVAEDRPELMRFGGMTGTVRTVNMSGRALVEFDAYDNIGWYDIDLDFLKVIDAPLPKEEAKPKKAAPKKAAPAKKPASGGKMSVEDMLAAARANKAAPAKKPAAAASTADILAAARGDASKAEAKPTEEKAPAKPAAGMSVAEMMAAARAEKSAAAETAAPEEPAAEEPVASEPEAVEEPAAESAESSGGTFDREKMSVEEMLAACRKLDGE
ncbi:MAG: hypothetical protein NXI22_18305 [bacterium]|nr:hypothetical protein [bacterium]